ncbi:MAG TPA: hypothetical protein VKH81_12745 [Candidatus Angelobacter sp.]|nr:hypothetical protein [Candidatus Angelobacter sp.]
MAATGGPDLFAACLRQELCARNASYAALHKFPHVTSYGEPPVIVYQPSVCGRKHGNFISASYQAIIRRPEWHRRLQKVHSQAKDALPRVEYRWRELDSSMSSDALLMNIFCHPGVTRRREVALLLGTDIGDVPEFGFRPHVPLLSGAKERTEVDMKLGSVLFEAKLTEGDFQIQGPSTVEQYRDFREAFDCFLLPRRGRDYVSYQLLRNVLAAYALNLQFCVLIDARRPDLLEQWYGIIRSVAPTDLRTRCKILTWQELACCLPATLERFLSAKYGIVAKPS